MKQQKNVKNDACLKTQNINPVCYALFCTENTHTITAMAIMQESQIFRCRLWLLCLFLVATGGTAIISSFADETQAVSQAAATPASGLNFGSNCFDWAHAKPINPSICRTSFALTEPRLMKGSCIRVDLHDKSLGFHVTGRAEHWGQPMTDYTNRTLLIRTRRQTARAFMLEARRPVAEGGKGLNMLLAVNTTPWSPFCAPWNHKHADRTGLIISNGELVAPPLNTPSFVVFKDGQVGFHKLKPDDCITNIQTAVSGFGMVLSNSIILAKNDAAKLAPRTGFGLSRDKRFLYLFVVDGRQPEYSMGANTYEVAEWLRYFGADSGMNMDGGGSTTLICWDPQPDPENKDPKSSATPNLHKLNRHKDNSERSIACVLGIYALPKIE